MTGSVVRRWVLLCAAAEAVGMTAAATAAKGAQRIADGAEGADGADPTTTALALGLALVVAGGLVEGVALGLAQRRAFLPTHPAIRRRAYLVLTVVVAGLGWAAASAPSALAGPGDGTAPPQVLVVLGGAGLGLVMGPLLGLAQSVALRPTQMRTRDWVVANTWAWGPAMAVIFLGATTPAGDWSLVAVALLGTLTGLVAGAVLGLVLGLRVSRLSGTSAPAD